MLLFQRITYLVNRLILKLCLNFILILNADVIRVRVICNSQLVALLTCVKRKIAKAL